MTRSTLTLLKNVVLSLTLVRNLIVGHCFSRKPQTCIWAEGYSCKNSTFQSRSAKNKNTQKTKPKTKSKTKTNKQKTYRTLSLGINYNNIRKMLLFARLIRKQTFLNHRTQEVIAAVHHFMTPKTLDSRNVFWGHRQEYHVLFLYKKCMDLEKMNACRKWRNTIRTCQTTTKPRGQSKVSNKSRIHWLQEK